MLTQRAKDKRIARQNRVKSVQEIASSSGSDKSPRQERLRSNHARPRGLAQSAFSTMRGSEQVLLLSEEPMVQGLLARALGQLGYSMFCVGNAAQAQFQAQSGQHLDLLLVDQEQPNTRNEELVGWFGATFPKTKVLMLTDSVSGSNLHLANSPHVSMLAKPFTLLQLARMLRLVLD